MPRDEERSVEQRLADEISRYLIPGKVTVEYHPHAPEPLKVCVGMVDLESALRLAKQETFSQRIRKELRGRQTQ